MTRNVDLSQRKSEEYYLYLSLWASILSVAILLMVGFFSHSQATFLSGIVGSIDIATSISVMVVLHLLKKPPTSNFQFGFYKLEPALIAFESGIVAVTCVQSMIVAVQALFHGVVTHNYFHGFILMTINAVINIVATLWMRHASLKLKSEIIVVEYKGWLIETLTETALWLSFLFGSAVYFFRWDVIKPYLPYMDPALTLLVSILVLREPIVIFYEAITDLIDAKPQMNLSDEEILYRAKQIAAQIGFGLKAARLVARKAGRAAFINLLYIPAGDVHIEKLYEYNAKLDTLMNELLHADGDQNKVIFRSILDA